jgi:hypothetical protein
MRFSGASVVPLAWNLHGEKTRTAMRRSAKAILQILLAAGATCAAAPPLAAPRVRCQADALGEWYCAAEPQGTAIVDNLGRVLCAPGACVKGDVKGDEKDWLCASKAGGRATSLPEGPRCDGECRAPEAKQCKKI